jgi:hypothetical protein
LALLELIVKKRPKIDRILAAVGLGVSLGLAALFRQSILPWLIPLYSWFVWRGSKAKVLKSTVWNLLGVSAVIFGLIVPVTIRNYKAYNGFLLLNSNAGYAMYSAQHPLHGTSFQEYTAAPLPNDIVPIPENEAEWDRVLMRKGLEFILREPGRYILLSLSRTADFFNFWPREESSLLFNLGRLMSLALFLPFMLVGLWRSYQEKERYSLLYLFIVIYSLMHLLTWAITRYRLPVDAVLLLFAAIGISEIYHRISSRFNPVPGIEA